MLWLRKLAYAALWFLAAYVVGIVATSAVDYAVAGRTSSLPHTSVLIGAIIAAVIGWRRATARTDPASET